MRAFIYSLLTDDDPLNLDAAALQVLIPVAQMRASGGAAVGPSIALPMPFLVIRDLSYTNVFRGTVHKGATSIHVHDNPDSYVRIDAITKIVQQIMNNVEPQWFGSEWVMDVEPQGWSEDLYDDHYGSATRYGTYGITANAIG